MRLDKSVEVKKKVVDVFVSRPKSGRDWHPHLPSYVSEPTNLTLTFQYNINRK